MSLSQRTRDRFDAELEQVLAQMPPLVHRLLEKFPCTSRTTPPARYWKRRGSTIRRSCVGCSAGVSMTEDSVDRPWKLPDVVTIYRLGILAAAEDRHGRVSVRRLRKEIRITDPARVGPLPRPERRTNRGTRLWLTRARSAGPRPRLSHPTVCWSRFARRLDAADAGIAASAGEYLGPAALAASPDGQTLYVACADADRVLVVDVGARAVLGAIDVPDEPTGLVLSPDGRRLYVTCASPKSTVAVIDAASRKIVGSLAAGHTATGPATLARGRSALRLQPLRQRRLGDRPRQPAVRRPGSRSPASRSPRRSRRDGRLLVVANHLPNGRVRRALPGRRGVAGRVAVAAGDAGRARPTAR